MAENKKSFLLYCDLIHTIETMPNDKAGELFKHILRYVNDQNPETNDWILQMAFEPIKQQLKRDLVKYEVKCLINKENVEKRWAKNNIPTDTTVYEPIPTDTNSIRTDTKNTDTDIDTDNDTGIDKEKKRRKKIFVPPSLLDVREYFTENGYKPDVGEKAFKGYNEANWHDSHGKPVLNWKQKMINVWFKDENKIPTLQSKKMTL